MKLLIYLLLLLTMSLTAQGKTDEKTLLDRIDKMIEDDSYYQGIKVTTQHPYRKLLVNKA